MERITKQALEECIPAGASEAIVEYIGRNIPEVPLDYSLLVFYTKVAQVLSLKRTIVKSEHIRDGKEGWYVNMYTMLFLGSGIGKDRTVDLISNVFMSDIKKRFYDLYNTYREEYVKQMKDVAIEKYKGDKKRQREWMRQNEPHNYAFELSRGTPQGVYSYRKSLKDVGIGGLMLQHGEFADYYLSKDENNQAFLDIMIDGYYGDTKAGVLKTEKSIEPVYGVPMNMLVHSANIDFINNDLVKERLYQFLGNGMARRSFVCVTKGNKLDEDINVDDYISEQRKIKQETEPLIPEITGKFTAVYDAIMSMKYPSYRLTEESDRMISEYQLSLRKQLNGIHPKHVEGELRGRVEKVIKLACIMSAFEDPTCQSVDASFVESARFIVEYYGQKYMDYFASKDKPDHQLLYDLLADHVEEWFTKSDIKAAKIAHGNFTVWLSECISLIESMLFDSDYKLEEEKNGSRGTRYRIHRRGYYELIDNALEKSKEKDEELRHDVLKHSGILLD